MGLESTVYTYLSISCRCATGKKIVGAYLLLLYQRLLNPDATKHPFRQAKDSSISRRTRNPREFTEAKLDQKQCYFFVVFYTHKSNFYSWNEPSVATTPSSTASPKTSGARDLHITRTGATASPADSMAKGLARFSFLCTKEVHIP